MSPLRVDNPPIEVSVAIRPLQLGHVGFDGGGEFSRRDCRRQTTVQKRNVFLLNGMECPHPVLPPLCGGRGLLIELADEGAQCVESAQG